MSGLYESRDNSLPLWGYGICNTTQECVDYLNQYGTDWIANLISAGDVVYVPSQSPMDYVFIGVEDTGMYRKFLLMCNNVPVCKIAVYDQDEELGVYGISYIFGHAGRPDFEWGGPLPGFPGYVFTKGREPVCPDYAASQAVQYAYPGYDGYYIGEKEWLLYKDGMPFSVVVPITWDWPSTPEPSVFVYPSQTSGW